MYNYGVNRYHLVIIAKNIIERVNEAHFKHYRTAPVIQKNSHSVSTATLSVLSLLFLSYHSLSTDNNSSVNGAGTLI